MSGAAKKLNPTAEFDLFEKLQKDISGFNDLAQLLKKQTGINLVENDKNLSLMAGRLAGVLTNKGLRTYKEYIQRLQTIRSPADLEEFKSSLTTNTTEFFREPSHFDHLKTMIPEIQARKTKLGQGDIRIWCAASSRGQEPYTIGMTVLDIVDPLFWDIKILGTDIDLEILDFAARGLYSDADVASLKQGYLQKYFNMTPKGYEAKAELKKHIRFAPLNLLDDYPFKFPFDIVFCRNVLIYFDSATTASVVDKLARSLGPEGVLYLGHCEAGVMRNPLLTTIGPSTFKKKA